MSFTKRLGLICAVSLLVSSPLRASTPLAFGTTYTRAVGVARHTNLQTFTGTAGPRLYVESLEADGLPISAALLSPGGVVLYQGNDDSDSGPWVLAEGGSYGLVIDGSAATTGNYAFRV